MKPFQDKEIVNVVYLGGSITRGVGASDYKKCWANKVSEYFNNKYPKIKFNHFNSGIGGTGSNYALLRFKKDVVDLKPDMLFIEFAVNDTGFDVEMVKYYLESMLMTLKAECEVMPYIMLVLAFQIKNDLLTNNEMAHKAFAEYYGLPYVDMKAKVLAKESPLEFARSLLTDTCHPNDLGYQFYSDAIIEELQKEQFVRPKVNKNQLHEKSSSIVCEVIPAIKLKHSSGWNVKENTLETDGIDETIEMTFYGRVLAITTYISFSSGVFRLYIDGEQVADIDTFCADPCINQPNLRYLTFELEDKVHNLKLVTQKSPTDRRTGNFVRVEYLISSINED